MTDYLLINFTVRLGFITIFDWALKGSEVLATPKSSLGSNFSSVSFTFLLKLGGEVLQVN